MASLVQINHSFAMCLDCEHVQCARSSFHTKDSVLRETGSLGLTAALHDRSENSTVSMSVEVCYGDLRRVYFSMMCPEMVPVYRDENG